MTLMADTHFPLGVQGIPQGAGGRGVDVTICRGFKAWPWAIPAGKLTLTCAGQCIKHIFLSRLHALQVYTSV